MSWGIVLICVVGSLLLMWGVAARAAKGSGGEARFARGKGASSTMITLSMVTAAMTGVTLVSVPGSVAGSAMSYLQMCLGFVLGYIVVAWVLLPRLHALKLLSLYEYLEERFGHSSHATGAALFFLSKLFLNALRLYLLCTVLQFMLYEPMGVPLWVNVAMMGMLVWLSTRRGGVRSVLWMDMTKTLIMMVCVVLFILLTASLSGFGVKGAIEAVSNHNFSQIWFVDDASDWRFLPKQLLAGLFMVVATTGLDQEFMQRAIGGGELKKMQRSMVVAVLLQTVIIALLLTLGVLLYIYLQQSGVTVGEGFPLRDASGAVVVEKGDQVLAFVATRGGMPLVVGVLFVVGVVVASFSSVGSAMTAQTTSLVVDIFGDRARGLESMERRRRVVLPLVALVTCLCVLAIERLFDDSVLNLTYEVASYSYGPLLGLFAFGMLTKRRVRDAWVPYIALAAPLLCWCIKRALALRWGYEVGFELLVMNGALTMCGLWLAGLAKK